VGQNVCESSFKVNKVLRLTSFSARALCPYALGTVVPALSGTNAFLTILGQSVQKPLDALLILFEIDIFTSEVLLSLPLPPTPVPPFQWHHRPTCASDRVSDENANASNATPPPSGFSDDDESGVERESILPS
jgi:hypothetical protein